MSEADVNIQGLEQLVARIVERFRPQRVVLFGSYAAGSPGPESDLDLLVVTGQPPARERRYEVKAELQQTFPLELQLVFMGADEFEETQDVVSGLAYPAKHFGRLLYEENPRTGHPELRTGLDTQGRNQLRSAASFELQGGRMPGIRSVPK